jgi:hypothetical protein
MLTCEDLPNTFGKCCSACHGLEDLAGWTKIKLNGKEYAICCNIRKLLKESKDVKLD